MATVDVPFGRSRSLRVRLPLAIAACIAVSIGACLLVSFLQVERTLVAAGEARAQAAAEQLSSLLTQSAQQRLAEVRRVAADPALLEYLRVRDDASAERARQKLATLTAANQPPAELWEGSNRVLAVAHGGETVEPPVAPSRPSVSGVTPFAAEGTSVYWTVAADVARAPGQGAMVVCRRVLTRPSGSDAISRLVGTGAVIRLRNQSGDVWTDLTGRVDAPDGPGQPSLLSASVGVRGTPWIVLVGFPQNVILAPARTFLIRMLLAAGALVLAATFAGYALTSRLTSPLRQLTGAAESIASGRRGTTVDISRQDEVGRLGAAFNTMVRQVEASQRDLEDRIEERTRDITTLNGELQQRVAQLKELTEELESFSYSVSHDLRAPLRHVAGFAALLDRRAADGLDDESRRYLRTIVESAARMGRLVDDLLAFSRMARGEIQTGTVDLNAVVADAAKEVRAQGDGRQIELRVHPLPPVTGDARLLRSVFVNLLSNAVKYTATRKVAEIEVGTRPGNAGERVVYVRDNGVGFDMAYADKLFGVFQRLHSADEFEGTGIGLANVRRIVLRHGGRAWAEAAVDRGATFFVSLPA